MIWSGLADTCFVFEWLSTLGFKNTNYLKLRHCRRLMWSGQAWATTDGHVFFLRYSLLAVLSILKFL